MWTEKLTQGATLVRRGPTDKQPRGDHYQDPKKRALNRLPFAYRIYGWGFTRILLRQLARHRPLLEELRRIPLHPLPKTLIEFDDRFTAPLSGFVDARQLA